MFERVKAERDQIWAEAVAIWKNGEPLYLDQELEAEARQRQKDYNGDGVDELAGLLAEYLDRPLPADWYTWELKRRQAFIQNPDPLAGESMRRDRFTPAEFAYEQLGLIIGGKDAKAICKQVRRLMENRPEWDKIGTIRIEGYGTQRGYKRAKKTAK